jgi:hypothetical protein
MAVIPSTLPLGTVTCLQPSTALQINPAPVPPLVLLAVTASTRPSPLTSTARAYGNPGALPIFTTPVPRVQYATSSQFT